MKTNGKQCGSYAVDNSFFCINHEPAMKEVKEIAVQKGGASEGYQKLNLDLSPLTIHKASDVTTATVQVMNEVRSGILPPKIATTLGYLLGIALKAFEVAELEEKMEVVDRLILERKTKR